MSERDFAATDNFVSSSEDKNQANSLAQAFANQIAAIHAQIDRDREHNANSEKLHVQTTGAAISELYEALRNASENAEENLQLMHAVQRWLKRNLLTPDSDELRNAGESLVAELTLAGYLPNDSVTLDTIDEISRLTREYIHLRNRLIEKVPHAVADHWTLEPLSAAIESQLREHRLSAAFTDFAYNYFLAAINVPAVFAGETPPSYEATLFVSIQKTLLRSDLATIRLNLLSRYQVSFSRPADFAKFNLQIDQIFASDTLEKLNHLIDRHGASWRILLKTLANDNHLAQHLANEKTFLGPFNTATTETYLTVNHNVDRGIIRSVVFLVITKFIIGIAIEVPYDLWAHGAIQWLPLTVNLLLPPLYMIALRLTLLMPDARNTRALNHEISRILFAPVPTRPFIGLRKGRTFGAIYNFIYTLTVLAVFVGVGWLLMHFAHFEWIHLAVFFLFISTASFLGFRLSRSIREIEVGDEAQTSVTMLRDFLYMPFVAVGRRISETYSKINIVSHFLDMFIELPLKTILSFVRRWGSFLSAKKDDF